MAALAAVVLAMTLWNSQGDYKVLYANLSDKDGGAIIAAAVADERAVPPRRRRRARSWCRPHKVHDVRLKLAVAGLPKGSVVGFELMDGARFGQTQFQERLNFQRGLEGELTRSITALAAVQNARVHLALPNQNGFFREQQKPTASVLLTLHPGRTLDRAQIAGIVHLVSSSVPEMSPKAVSVLDQTGALLSANADTPQSGLDAQQLQYVNQVESGYTKRILELLEPVVGRDNLRATVTADIDFSQTEATAEQFKPNQGAERGRGVRSQQVSESSGTAGAAPSGVPGAASNQPPVPATAPITGAAPPLQAAPGGAQRQQPARRGDQLRGRQDRARDAQRHRHRQAPERRGGGQPPQHGRREGQDHDHAAVAGRDRQADRAGAGEHRLQAGARRLGQGDQRAVQGRARPRRSSRCRCGSSRRCSTCCVPPRCRPPGAGGAAGLLRHDPAGAQGGHRAAAGARRPARSSARWSTTRPRCPTASSRALRRAQEQRTPDGRARAGQGEPGRRRQHRARLGQRRAA